MTRINLIDPKDLVYEHLIGEYKEMPRVVTLSLAAWEDGRFNPLGIPRTYRLGTGHVKFFYNKLGFIRKRYISLVSELEARGVQCNKSMIDSVLESINSAPEPLMGEYDPIPEEAYRISLNRINERLKEMEYV